MLARYTIDRAESVWAFYYDTKCICCSCQGTRIFLQYSFFIYFKIKVCMYHVLSRFSRVQLFATLWRPPGSSIPEILQARILEWVAISHSRDLRDAGIEPASPTTPALQLTATAYELVKYDRKGNFTAGLADGSGLGRRTPWGESSRSSAISGFRAIIHGDRRAKRAGGTYELNTQTRLRLRRRNYKEPVSSFAS